MAESNGVPQLDKILSALPLPADLVAASSGRPVLVGDDLTPRQVFVAADRASRPTFDGDDCPFCPGGREVPTAVGAVAVPNRWPPILRGRAEVIVHGPVHDRDFASMAPSEVRAVVDLWVDRSVALGRLEDVRSVLVFENRGEAAGATVEHPHSQIFALPVVPPMLAAPAGSDDCVACLGAGRPARVAERFVDSHDGWLAVVPPASPSPYAIRLTPSRHVTTLTDLTSVERDGLAVNLTRTVRRLDGLFGSRMPYQLWVHQPTDHDGHLSVTLAGLLRAPGKVRILGAAELATGLLFVPIDPAAAASALRRTAVPAEGQERP
jgi:UDPglucose--hexose-1-phosphate uridylyltransferase